VSHFSHGDPHAANVLLRSRGVRPCIIDFGFCAQIDPRHSHAWSSVIVAAQQMQPQAVYEALESLGFEPDPALAPLSRQEQALAISKRLIQSQVVGMNSTEDLRIRLSNIEQLARHNLIHLDFLFLLRILNYVRNLFTYVSRHNDFIPTYTCFAALATGLIVDDSPPPVEFD
jgi:predicted unusual protein kinase regulating ubiquinone biosynthesis (AarF/ABC1/UbiB family)